MWYGTSQDAANPRWKMWDGVVTSRTDLEAWCTKVHLRAYILTKREEAGGLEAIKGAVDTLFVSDELLTAYPITYWQGLEMPIYNLTNLHANFPFLSVAWDGTLADAVAMVALFYRYRRLAAPAGTTYSEARAAHLGSLGVRTMMGTEPPQIWLITQYFVHSVARRTKEFRQCLKNNLLNPYLDKVVYLNEKDLRSEWSSFRGKEKVVQEIIGERLTYKHLLQYTYEKVPENVIVVYANADIYLNDTLKELYAVAMEDKLFALLRYDEDAEGNLKIFGPRADSQDTWMLLSDSVKSRTWDWASFDYKLGTAGCDNRFTADMFAMRFLASNPCHTIQTVHIHKTEIRDYNPRDILPARFYLYLNPCPIINMDQTKNTPAKLPSSFPSRTATIALKCPTPKLAHTFSVMLGRHKRFVWSHEAPTPYTSPARAIHKWTNANVIGAGIVHDYGKTYIDSEVGGAYLQDATMPLHITYTEAPTFVDRMLAIPTKQADTLTNPDLYLVRYFSYATQLTEQLLAAGVSPCTFFIPEAYLDVTKYFRIKDVDAINAVKWTPTSVVHAKEVYGLLPEGAEFGVEDIRALRFACQLSPIAKPAGTRRCIVLVDEVLTEAYAKEQIGAVLGEGWEVVCVGAGQTGPAVYTQLLGADLCLLFNLPEHPASKWMKLWAAPAKCKVVEFQNELKVVGEFQHFAAACEFDTYLAPLHKAPPEGMRKQALEALQTLLKTE